MIFLQYYKTYFVTNILEVNNLLNKQNWVSQMTTIHFFYQVSIAQWLARQHATDEVMGSNVQFELVVDWIWCQRGFLVEVIFCLPKYSKNIGESGSCLESHCWGESLRPDIYGEPSSSQYLEPILQLGNRQMSSNFQVVFAGWGSHRYLFWSIHLEDFSRWSNFENSASNTYFGLKCPSNLFWCNFQNFHFYVCHQFLQYFMLYQLWIVDLKYFQNNYTHSRSKISMFATTPRNYFPLLKQNYFLYLLERVEANNMAST